MILGSVLGGLFALAAGTVFFGAFAGMYVRASRFRRSFDPVSTIAVRGRGSPTGSTFVDGCPVVCVLTGESVIWRRFGPFGTSTRTIGRSSAAFKRTLISWVTPCLVETSAHVSFLASHKEIDLLEHALRARGFTVEDPDA